MPGSSEVSLVKFSVIFSRIVIGTSAKVAVISSLIIAIFLPSKLATTSVFIGVRGKTPYGGILIPLTKKKTPNMTFVISTMATSLVVSITPLVTTLVSAIVITYAISSESIAVCIKRTRGDSEVKSVCSSLTGKSLLALSEPSEIGVTDMSFFVVTFKSFLVLG